MHNGWDELDVGWEWPSRGLKRMRGVSKGIFTLLNYLLHKVIGWKQNKGKISTKTLSGNSIQKRN